MAKTMMAFAAALIVLAGMPAAAYAQGVTPDPSGAAAPQEAAAGANAFNRLLTPPARHNLPPAEDGIHDPASPGTPLLQAPREAFGPLPKSNFGNRVNWVSAAESGKIRPLWNAADHKAQPQVLDLNIVREVKGSMPDVVFPHKRHTDLLDCANCHPALFVPQKGANKMSMAAIMLGESCGACHGRVAFPVSECRLCHSKAKAMTEAGGAAARSGARQ